MREKKEKAERESSQRKEAYKAGKTHGISGRELFEFNPEFAQGDDEEAGDDDVIMIRREVRLVTITTVDNFDLYLYSEAGYMLYRLCVVGNGRQYH